MSLRICAVLALTVGACGVQAGDGATPADNAGAPQGDDDAPPGVGFTETYDAGTLDVGSWILTTNTQRPRLIEPFKGNPDGYLFGEVSGAIPAWATSSTRYQPNGDGTFKRDSVFVGDYLANDVQVIRADLVVIQAGAWTPDRTVTLRLRTWNAAKNNVAFDATFSLPNIPAAPAGWKRYEFPVAARSPTVPRGWVFRRGDGLRGTDADWAVFMQRIDLVGLELGKPGFVYPSFGVWRLGIDNIHIGAAE